MGIEFSDETNKEVIVNTEPIVTYSGYLEFKKGDKVIGKVNAEFDFREMPDEHHHMALQLIMNGARTLYLPVTPVTKEEPKKERKKWFGLF
jgi:hypothetical protein